MSREHPGDVLVVEDDPIAREVLCGTLMREGFDVREAGSVERALVLILERAPDVVITDLQLPGRDDGVELARRLRSVAATAEMGLIAVSGAVEPEWPTVRYFDAYLRKPLDVDALVPLVKRLAEHARSRRSDLASGAR